MRREWRIEAGRKSEPDTPLLAYGTAHAGGIVSRDTQHLLPRRQFEGIPILSTAEAVKLLESQEKRAA